MVNDLVLPHEVFDRNSVDAASVFRKLKPLPQEVFRESFEKGDISKEDFEVLTHNWCVMENIRTGIGVGNNEPFLIEGSISGRFIPNNYDDVAYDILNKSWNYKLVYASSGMGKSVKLGSHAEQISMFYGLPIIRADRKPPWIAAASRYPNNDSDGCERLRRWNFVPCGLSNRLVLFRAPNTPTEGIELKVDLASIWEALAVDEELEDSYHRVFATLFEVKPDGQQGANALLDFIMSARPDTFTGLLAALDNKKLLMSQSKERFDQYFYSRVKRCRRYIVNTTRDRLNTDALLLKKWQVCLRGERTLRPFFSLATDIFDGSTKHAFTEYYFHTLFYRLLKNGSLPALFCCDDETDAIRSSPLLRELSFWKARKLRALNYSSESATQDITLFSKDQQNAAQTIQFGGGGKNKEFAKDFSEGMDFNVLVDIEYLPEKYWCLINRDKGFHFVYPAKGSMPSFCGYITKQARLKL